MAALNFPTSPTPNQVYTSGGKSWYWNGYAWKTFISQGSANTAAQYQVAYYATAGQVVSGSANMSITGSGLTINYLTESNSIYSGALNVLGGVGIGKTLNVGGYISIWNGSNYTGFKSSASSNVIYNLPATVPSIGSSVLQSDTSGNLSWVPLTSSSSSGTVNSSGANFLAYYASSGSAVTGNTNISVSGTGLSIGFTTNATDINTGGLTIAGGAGIAGTLWANTIGVGGTLTYVASNLLGSFSSSVNSYNQVIIQNKSNGASASADFVLNNNLSTDSTYYGNLGMNSSGFTGSGSLSLPNAVYLSSTTGDLVLGSTTTNLIRFVYNSGATDTMQISGTGVSILSTTSSTSISTGALTISGGVGIGGSIFSSTSNASSISGVILNNGAITNTGTITSTGVMTLSNSSTTAFQVRDGSNVSVLTIDTIGDIVSIPVAIASTTTSTGSLVVAGGVGIGRSASIGGRLQMFNGANYTAFVSSASGNTVYTLPASSPATGTSVLQSTSAGVMSWVPMTASGGSGITLLTAGTGISFSTGSTITSTGTIRAKRPMVVSFCAGYTPAASGADTVVIRLPDSPSDGVTSINYEPQEFHVRVETASATATTIQLEKYTGTGAFSGTALTSISIVGASTYENQTSVFAGAGSLLTSGDKLRINFTTLSASHANFSVYLELEEV